MSQILSVNGVEYIPAAAAGKRFGYTRDYILMLARDRKVRAEKIGHKWYVDPQSVDDFFSKAKEVREIRRRIVSEDRKRELRAHTARRAPKKTHTRLLVGETVAILLLAFLLGTTGYLGVSVSSTQHAQAISGASSFFERLAVALFEFISPAPEVVTTTETVTTHGSDEGGMQGTVLEGAQGTTTYTSLVVAPDTVLTTTTVDSIRASFSDDVSVSIDPEHPDTGVIVPQFRDRDGESYRFIMVPVQTGNE